MTLEDEIEEKRNTIKSDQFPYDMAPWLEEKAENAIKPILEIIKILKKQNLDDEIVKDLEYNFDYALFDMTKLLSFASGGKWDISDSKVILENPDEGFEEVMYKYGMIFETKKQKRELKKKIYKDFIKKIYECLELEQFPGRSALQELFEDNSHLIDRSSLEGRALIYIEDCLFKMAHGEINWDTFVKEAKDKREFIRSDKEA
jgi:hypothetical protein